MKKKAWEKPKLIVLVRGRPEEMILEVCKIDGGPAGPELNNPGCWQDTGTICEVACSGLADS